MNLSSCQGDWDYVADQRSWRARAYIDAASHPCEAPRRVEWACPCGCGSVTWARTHCDPSSRGHVCASSISLK